FVFSDEYRAGIIVHDYQQLLGRTPGGSEVTGWLTAMRLGMTDEQVLASFAGSAEYYQRAGGTDRAWIDGPYHDLLGRTPSMAEENAWLQVLAGGDGRSDIAYGFAHSSEREARLIMTDYQNYLGRAPGGSETATWVGAFEQGALSNEQIVSIVASSDE